MPDPDRMEKALRDIEAWARAYPLKVFPEASAGELRMANEMLLATKVPGLSVDSITAGAMRDVLDGIINIVRDGLGDP